MSDYDSTFNEETLHEIFTYANNPVNEPVLGYISDSQPVEMDELYEALDGDLNDREINSAVIGMHEGRLIHLNPAEEDRERKQYLEATTLGEYAVAADSPEEYVSLIEEVDRLSEDWE